MSQASQHLLQQVHTLTAANLRPLVAAIDCDGLYPENFLRELGALGGFKSLVPAEHGGSGLGLGSQIEVLSAIGEECGSTAFLGWCQSACAWYLLQTHNAAVRARYLPGILSGGQLAGTGMSNTIKHLCGMERHFLQATAQADGYLVHGGLPWVSNLGATHAFAATAQLPDGRYVMFMASGQTPGITLRPRPEFCALEGTRTLNVRFDNVSIRSEDVLAGPGEFAAYVARIKPGFILLQMGMCAGVVQGCLKIIRESNAVNATTNAFLNDPYDALQAEWQTVWQRTLALADAAQQHHAALIDVLQLRLAGSELALRAAQSAALHAGARGYLRRHAAQRRSREALFVAIVTPAIKQLRREIAQLGATGVVTSSALPAKSPALV